MVVDAAQANKSFGLHQYMWGYEEIFVYLPLISIENWDPLVDPTLVVQKINGCDKWIAKSTKSKNMNHIFLVVSRKQVIDLNLTPIDVIIRSRWP